VRGVFCPFVRIDAHSRRMARYKRVKICKGSERTSSGRDLRGPQKHAEKAANIDAGACARPGVCKHIARREEKRAHRARGTSWKIMIPGGLLLRGGSC